MKKTVSLFVLLTAGTLFAQHNMQHKMASSQSADMMMSMHHQMMTEPFVTGVHPDISFLVNMIPHHQGAIDSSKMMLKMSKKAEIRKIAQGIITLQEKEIADFNTLIGNLKKENKSLKGINVKKYDAKAKADMDAMMEQMSSVELSGDIDRDYLMGMIAHHAGAVAASKQVLMYTADPRVKQVAETIIADQEKEILQFQGILSR